MGAEYVLTLSCPDGPGIVHEVSGFLARAGCNILDSQQYGEGTFFMRVHAAALEPVTMTELRAGFAEVAVRRGMTWHLVDAADRARVLILVSRFGHCLNDLLFRRRIGALPVDVPVVASNHPDLADLATSQGVPFELLPAGRAASEDRITALVEEHDVDLVVLARYMQILSPELCARLDGRAINIHHSFLPGFVGARPYQRARERGVKLIGATAHYVTTDLDEGPIIEQDVVRIDHSYSVDELVAAGRDVECQVLARAVAWHTQNRVLRHGRRTVVLR